MNTYMSETRIDCLNARMIYTNDFLILGCYPNSDYTKLCLNRVNS